MRVASAIREIVAARTVPIICAAYFEGRAQIWDLKAQQKTSDFPVRFAFGSASLAIHPAGDCIVAGISAKSGSISSYAVPSGKEMWFRDRVEYCAYLGFSYSGRNVFFTRRRQSVERVDSSSGVTVELLTKMSGYVEGPGELALMAPLSKPSYLIRGKHEIPIPKLTFSILDVAFGAKSVCITESGGPVRCIDSLTGTERWRYAPPNDSHVLKLHFNHLDGYFYGVVWHYEKGLFRYLARFDAETGEVKHMSDLNSWEEAFSSATQQLVTSSGEILDLSSGELAGKLAFPLTEYPDRITRT